MPRRAADVIALRTRLLLVGENVLRAIGTVEEDSMYCVPVTWWSAFATGYVFSEGISRRSLTFHHFTEAVTEAIAGW